MRQVKLNCFYAATRTAKKIVVVDLGFLGDTLQLIPALCEIKRHYPAAALQVLSSPLGAEVLHLAPCVDRVWPLELDPAKRTLREHARLIRALRRERFDVSFNFGGNDRATILAGFVGARQRVAHAAGRKHFWNRWLIPNWVPRQDQELSVFEQRRRVLAECGFELQPARYDLGVAEHVIRWAAPLVPPGAVHLSVNSANPLKEWPLEHYAAMLRAVWQHHPETAVVATAGARERERVRLRELQALVNDPRLRLLLEQLSIAQLAGVLKHCRLHVGPDSGVMHLAVALGLPTLSFFREQGGYKAWMPSGAGNRVITVPCHCVDNRDAPCEKLGQAQCLAQIQPAQIAGIVGECLTRIIHKPHQSPAGRSAGL